MDYTSHPFHKIIHNNWSENFIPNIVLSSATLPKTYEINETVSHFKSKFDKSTIYNIEGNDCKKTIPMISKDGFVIMPHYLCETYEDLIEMAKHIENNVCILRYLDLKEALDFIEFVTNQDFLTISGDMKRHIMSLDDVNMLQIKLYYLTCLQNLRKGSWGAIFITLQDKRALRLKDNMTDLEKSAPKTYFSNKSNVVHITTKDAYTLTDGPSIYLAEDIKKVANFMIQQSEIPKNVMDNLLSRITYNNNLNRQLHEKEKELEDIEEALESKEESGTGARNAPKTRVKCEKHKQFNRNDGSSNTVTQKLNADINYLRSNLKSISLNDTFVPNKPAHLDKWYKTNNKSNAFTSSLDEQDISSIMGISGVDDTWKLLLIMGIGVFTNHDNVEYIEVMKNLASNQKLYLIIAESDYIFGMNYQFCHGYIGKEMNLTQEKIIQAMGRIGRNNIQQSYTIRFRNDADIYTLLQQQSIRPEVDNMNRLFNGQSCI